MASKRRGRSSKPGQLQEGEVKITFIASPEDQKIIEQGQAKNGIRKKSEIIRMALRKYAEYLQAS